MLDYVSDFDIFCWRSKNMLYFLENRAWNGAFEKPLLMLRRFFENPQVLPWTLRDLRKPTSASLNLKGSSKTHQSSLTLKFFLKSTRPSLPLKKGLSKTHQSSLTLKGGSTSHLGLLPSGKKRKPLLLVALNRFAIWLADHQRSTPAAELRFFVRDEPQGHTMLIARNLLGLLLMGTQGYNKYLLL